MIYKLDPMDMPNFGHFICIKSHKMKKKNVPFSSENDFIAKQLPTTRLAHFESNSSNIVAPNAQRHE